MLERALLCLTVLFSINAAARSDVLIDVEDPPGDSDGPGFYLAPMDADLTPPDFDLRRFVARLDGDQVVLEVSLSAIVKQPDSAWRANSIPVELTNGIFLQNIDIYVDTDPNPATPGMSTSIPGRRVGFADGHTWKRAIVLAPQRALVASIISDALGKESYRVTVPGPVIDRGKTMVVKVPVSFFGSTPNKSWGWSVQLSGAAWSTSFYVVNQITGTSTADALTMPVTTTPDRWAFGGAKLGRYHPQIVDVILPKGVDQKQVLSGFDNLSGQLVSVPFIYGEPPPAAVAVSAPPPAATGSSAHAVTPTAQAPQTNPDPWSVVDLTNELVSISGPSANLKEMMFGTVVDLNGAEAAHVLVIQVVPTGVVAKALDNRDKIIRGAKVKFPVKP